MAPRRVKDAGWCRHAPHLSHLLEGLGVVDTHPVSLPIGDVDELAVGGELGMQRLRAPFFEAPSTGLLTRTGSGNVKTPEPEAGTPDSGGAHYLGMGTAPRCWLTSSGSSALRKTTVR